MKSGYPPRVAGKAVYFAKPEELRAWLDRHHDDRDELLVGFHKRGSGVPSVTWPEAVDEALCFGWIDAVRYRIDETSYRIRFTPRKPRSTWSNVNVKRVAALKKLGRMSPAGLAAFAKADPKRSGIYAYERNHARLGAAYEKKLKANKTAWDFFRSQPPWYRRLAAWFVVSAKKEETRARRVDVLIAHCAAGRRLGPAPSKER